MSRTQRSRVSIAVERDTLDPAGLVVHSEDHRSAPAVGQAASSSAKSLRLGPLTLPPDTRTLLNSSVESSPRRIRRSKASSVIGILRQTSTFSWNDPVSASSPRLGMTGNKRRLADDSSLFRSGYYGFGHGAADSPRGRCATAPRRSPCGLRAGTRFGPPRLRASVRFHPPRRHCPGDPPRPRLRRRSSLRRSITTRCPSSAPHFALYPNVCSMPRSMVHSRLLAVRVPQHLALDHEPSHRSDG